MIASKANASVDLPTLFDSDEPLFLTPVGQDEMAGQSTDESDLSFDNTGDLHDTCTW